MRLFLAVDVPDDVRSWAQGVRRTVERAAPGAARGLRWVGAEQLHLTLRFLGEVEEHLAARVVQALSTRVPFGPFVADLAEPRFIPSAARPRVLVATIGRGQDTLGQVKDALDGLLGRVEGLRAEERPFLAHLTLARVRDGSPPGRSAAVAILEAFGHVPALTIPVDHVTLYRSRLTPAGGQYEVVSITPLGSGGRS